MTSTPPHIGSFTTTTMSPRLNARLLRDRVSHPSVHLARAVGRTRCNRVDDARNRRCFLGCACFAAIIEELYDSGRAAALIRASGYWRRHSDATTLSRVCPADDLRSPKILILQSADDHDWATELAALLTRILQLAVDQVRCKSIEAARLPPGSEQYDALKRDAQGVPVVIAVISDATLASPLDLFEFGATWAATAPDSNALFIPIVVRASNPVQALAIDALSSRVAPIDGARLEDLVGQIAGHLAITPVNIGSYRGRLIQLAAPRTRKSRKRGTRKRIAAGWLIVSTVAGLAIIGATVALIARPQSSRLTREQLGFEEDTTVWSIASSGNEQGFARAARSNARAHLGSYSLEVQAQLSSTDANRRTGEVLFDLRKSFHVNSADLASKSITAWVYAPSGCAGEAAKPNGFQLLVKDRNWRSQYGTWNNASEGRWTKLTMSVGSANGTAHTDEGFQSNAILSIGVKMSLGEGSKADCTGAIYIDSIDW